MSQLLARLKRDPLADLPLADCLNQLPDEQKVLRRGRLLPPLVALRLFLIQIAHGNCAIAALPHLSGIAFAALSYDPPQIGRPLGRRWRCGGSASSTPCVRWRRE